MIILKLSKPQNNYCAVLDGDRTAQSADPVSPSCPPPPFHILDFARSSGQDLMIVLYLWRTVEALS